MSATTPSLPSAKVLAGPARFRPSRLMLLLPAAALLGVVFAYPLLNMVWQGFHVADKSGVTTANFKMIFDTSVYLKIFWITFQIALLVTALCVILGYPLAYLIAAAPPRVAGLLLVVLLTPFLTSVLVRTYGFLVILSPHGVLNQALHDIGIGPVNLVYNRIGVLIGMTLTLLPYMVFTLYGNMRAVDRRLLDAAQNLGASRWHGWRTVFLPLSLPGLASGALLVFLLALGYFVTPELMGGQHDVMLGTVIQEGISQGYNAQLDAALATLLLVLVFLVYAVCTALLRARTQRRDRETRK